MDPGERIKDCFRRWDTDGDGAISKAELHGLLERLCGLESTEIDTVFQQVDLDRDGKVQYEEFVDWLMDDTVSFYSLAGPAAGGAPPARGAAERAHAALRALVEGGSIASAMEDLGIEIALDGEEPDLPQALASLELLSAKRLREIFGTADVDRSGHLQLGELHRLLFPHVEAEAGAECALAVAKVCAQMDRNRDGRVTCGEFVAFALQWKKRLQSAPTDAEKRQLAAAFAGADADSSGSLSLEELERLLGCDCEEDRRLARRGFEAADANGDGSLSVLEFSRLYGKELVQESKGIEVEWKCVPSESDEEDDSEH